MTNLSVSIMAHPLRYKNVRDVVKPAFKNCKDLFVSFDTNSRGLWWNAFRCWRNFGADSTHHMVIQDDTKPCNNFYSAAIEAINANPDALISWFGKPPNMPIAIERGDHWLTCKRGAWGACFSMPTATVKDWLVWIAEHVSLELIYDDIRFAMYAEKKELDIWLPAPSLVQHPHPPEERSKINSLFSHFNTPTDYFPDDDEDPALWDWTVPPVPSRSSVQIDPRYWQYYKE